MMETQMKFYIQGGYLDIKKMTFVKEMLSPSSVLKKLLNYEIEDNDKKRVITVDRENSEGTVKVNFTEGSNVYVGEDYRELLAEVKKRHKGDVRGQITLMAVCYTTFFIRLDLDSDTDRISEKSLE